MSDRWRAWAALVFGAVVAAPGFGSAQTAPPFDVLLRQVQATSPRIQVGGAELRAAEAQARQAAARPNPTLGLEVEDFGGERPYRDFDQAQTTVSLGQVLEIGGKRGARMAVATADVSAARARADQGRIEFGHALAVAYAEAEAAEARHGIAQDALELAESDARAVRLLVENGKEAQVRALQADAALAGARADAAQVRARRTAALSRLSALAGVETPYRGVTTGFLDRIWTPSAGASESPALAAARAERDAAARRVDVERRRRAPDVTLSVGLRRFEGDDATAAVVGLSAPLPLFDRNQGGIATALANADAARARQAAAEAELAADRRSAEGEAEAANLTIDAARQGEAAAEEGYRLARLGYGAGKLSLLELLNARRALIEARGRNVDARLARLKAVADLARARGQIPFGDPS
jgi:cobalt-zinc-cadmium efflux system outer membrane protein